MVVDSLGFAKALFIDFLSSWGWAKMAIYCIVFDNENNVFWSILE